MTTTDRVPASSTLLAPAALCAIVRTEYDVGAPLHCRLWLNGVSETYLVTTAHAPYILRVYRAGWRRDADIAFELEALQHLARHGVAVAVPVARRDGTWMRELAAPEGRRQLVLFTYAPGREAYLEDGYALRYGRSVAEIHAASDDFASGQPRFALDGAVLVERPLARIAPLLRHRPVDWQYLCTVTARVRTQIERQAASLEWGFCHGDTLGSNAVLEGEQLTHFDFDDCGFGWRAYDLATYLWICTWTAEQTGPGWWEAFLQGYQERRRLGATDVAAVPLFVVLRELWVIGQQTRMAAIHGYKGVDDAYFDERLRFLRAWEPQLPEAARTA